MRQYHSPDGADGCRITSNKSLTYLQLVFTSNWSSLWHAFASRGFVTVSWAFLYSTNYNDLKQSLTTGVLIKFCKMFLLWLRLQSDLPGAAAPVPTRT